MKMIFDTHAHYDDSAFDSDRDELLTKLFSENVACIVNQGTTVELSKCSIALAEQYENMYCAVGIHPECVTENSLSELDEIRQLARHKKAVAIGEIGLDYYWDTPRDLQKAVFEQQLLLAEQLHLPVTIHDREAHGDVLAIIQKYRPKGILHCFSGSVETAREIIRLGMYIGVGGVVTFKNSRKAVDVVADIPLERIVLETDCPYLSPVPFRGKRNDSSMIQYVALKIAEIKHIPVEEVLKTTLENAKRVYQMERCVFQ